MFLNQGQSAWSAKLSFIFQKCEKEFKEYIKDKLVAAKADFRELLQVRWKKIAQQLKSYDFPLLLKLQTFLYISRVFSTTRIIKKPEASSISIEWP